MKRAAAAIAVVAALALTLTLVFAKQPEITYQFPQDGAILEEAPLAVQLCFRDPIDIRDLREGGDFSFLFVDPGGNQLGHRAIFQPDAHGVVIQPGISASPEGGWRFEWRVRDSATEEPSEGTIRYTVKEGGSAIIPAEPPPCGSATTTPEPGVEGPAQPDEGDGPDVLLLALLTTGAAAGAAVIGVIGYFVRRRIGFSPHRPPNGGGGGGTHH